MPKPRKRIRKPEGNQIFLDLGNNQISFDKGAFDGMIRSQGVTLVHHKAMPSPIGLAERDDIRHPNHTDGQGSNGYIYRVAGCVTVAFSNNAGKNMPIDMGEQKLGTAMVSVPRFYDDKKDEPVLLTIYDRLYVKDCEVQVENWQRVEAHATGVDRLTYPAAKVLFLVDSRGNEYAEGVEFDVCPKGNVVWRKGKSQPGTDPVSGKGTIYSIRYRYIPHWYVRDLLHEVRVAQTTDLAKGTRTVERMPYLAVVQREYVFMNQQRDGSDDGNGGGEDDGRKVQASRSGKLLGPR